MTYKILITRKSKSRGGGSVTIDNLASGLTSAGYEVRLFLTPERNNSVELLPDVAAQMKPHVIIYDDITRVNLKAAFHAPVNILLVLGMPNVHREYYFHSGLFNLNPVFSKVFVRQKSLAMLLEQWYEDKTVYWPGGTASNLKMNITGYIDPRQNAVRVSSFSQAHIDTWWKNPIINSLVAFSLFKKYPNIYYFKTLRSKFDDLFASMQSFPIRGTTTALDRNILLREMSKTQLGIELALADACPRVVNEMLALGIPCLVSSTVEHIADHKFLREMLVVSSPNNIFEAQNKGLKILENRTLWLELSQACKELMVSFTTGKEFDMFHTVLQKELLHIDDNSVQIIPEEKILSSSRNILQKESLYVTSSAPMSGFPIISKQKNVRLSPQKLAAIGIKRANAMNRVANINKFKRAG